MPNDFLVYAAQAYIAHPAIHIGYRIIRGGVGTVSAMVILQPILIAHANTSIKNLKGCVR
jgi:hypothetical protein